MKMKKILLTISTAAFMFVGCDLDINDNPNYPQDDRSCVKRQNTWS